MTRPTRRRPAHTIATAIVAVVASVSVLGAPAAATTPPDETLLTLPPDGTAVDNDFIDLERELSECVGSALPKPGCGREPTHSGDRGSAIQWSVFGVMVLGIGFIGWRIVAGARRARPGTP